jgi:hypothetical protein
MPVIKSSIGPHDAPVASTSGSQSTTPSTPAHSTRPQSPILDNLSTLNRSPSANNAADSTSFRTTDAPPGAHTRQPEPAAPTAHTVLKNDSNEAQFYPLVDEIKNHDDKYVYMTHGTRLDNMPGISEHGLDPDKGGSRLGAASYEGGRNTDSIGNLKYGNDPNVSLRYANEPAERSGQVGVQLEARVDKDQFLSHFNSRSHQTQAEPFWRPERGGENNPARMNDPRYRASMKPAMPKDENRSPVWSSETNMHVEPQDIRVIGVSVPPGQEVDTSAFRTRYGIDSTHARDQRRPDDRHAETLSDKVARLLGFR